MKYLSVCSGIEAASAAWMPLGWKPVAFSEIEPFPCSVLAHHHPDVPNWGDMTRFEEWPDESIDLLCGGTPCQSFSVAGLRKGLADPRGNLMLTFGAIAAKYRPRWLVWENVPGVLSSNGGRDFGSFLGLLGELGYGFAYRVLDAQYVRVESHPRAVPQRRRRVFVVGHSGGLWQRAAAVLFERESLRGHPAPRREAGEGITQDTAPCLTSSGRGVERTGDTRGQDPVVAVAFGGNNQTGPIDVATARNACASASGRMDFETETFLVAPVATAIRTANTSANGHGISDELAHTLDGAQGQCVAFDTTHTLRGEGFDASEDGTGRGTPLAPVGVDHYNGTITGEVAATLSTGGATTTGSGPSVMIPVAFHPTQDPISSADGTTHCMGAGSSQGSATIAVAVALRGREGGATAELGDEVQNCLRASSGGGDKPHVLHAMRVRRLTPTEAERLMGFPDGHTAIPHKGKPAADGPRYKALGNSWAVNCARWIGERIEQVEGIPA